MIEMLILYLCKNLPQIHQLNQTGENKREGSLADLQNNIVATINLHADNLEGMIIKISMSIQALKKSVDFAFGEVEVLKSDVKKSKLPMIYLVNQPPLRSASQSTGRQNEQTEGQFLPPGCCSDVCVYIYRLTSKLF